MISKEQLDWLKGNQHFSSLTDMLSAAKDHFAEEELIPTIALSGRTGAGKSSLINAIAGQHVSEVGVIPTTQTVTPQMVEQNDVPLLVLDMPGVGEAGKHGQRMETLLGQMDRAHILLLAIPCPDRSLDYEQSLLNEVRAHFSGRVALPVLAVGTKIDLAQPTREWIPLALNLQSPVSEKERNICDWLQYAQSALCTQLAGNSILPCANGESWDDTANQYGVPALRLYIFEHLPDAAKNYFTRLTQDRLLIDKRAESVVRNFSLGAATAAMQPVPAVPDAVLIMPIQLAMLAKLTYLHGKELSNEMAAKLLGPLAARMAGRFAFEQLCKFIPGVGSAAGAVVAGGMTYALGMSFHTLLHDGTWNFDAEALKDEVMGYCQNIDVLALAKRILSGSGK